MKQAGLIVLGIALAVLTWNIPPIDLHGQNQVFPIMGTTAPGSGSSPTTVTYSGNSCNTSSVTSTSITCTYGAGELNAGHAVIGILTVHSTSVTVTSICDGTGTGGCTGSSTYTIQPAYKNGSTFESFSFYTCNYAGTALVINATVSSSIGLYIVSEVANGNSTSGCLDQYNKNQTASGTTITSGAVTTTNAHDLLICHLSNWIGGTVAVGVDGQGNTMVTSSQLNASGVASTEYFNETATNTYTPTWATVPSGPNNAETLAIK